MGKNRGGRRKIVLEMLARMEALQAELQDCSDVERKEKIASELRLLRRGQNRLSMKRGEPKTYVAKLPETFLERERAARKVTARVSGRDKITARFVQGGAPGTGGRRG